MHKGLQRNFSFIQRSNINEEAPNTSIQEKHHNKNFYDPILDYDDELKDDIRLYGRDKPDELDFTDVWESSY